MGKKENLNKEKNSKKVVKLSHTNYGYKKRSQESYFVLTLTIFLILFFLNTADEIVVNFASNAVFSVILSIIVLAFWFIFTKK
ncbi:MAG: hypothetical protein KKH88_01635 [Nanoarchaeota archaeon]|nr:hypothetical protein [Nanoarchaeota archaeon]